MKPTAFYTILGIGVLLIAGVVYWGLHQHPHKQVSIATPYKVATDTPPLTGLSIYTNGQYGFSIFYPGADKTEKVFDSQYHLPATWRVNALPNASGTPIIAIIGYQTTSSSTFPRYFETEVRVGASTDPQELAACEKPGDGESALPDKVIQSVTWKAFALQDAGMMQYLQGTSYRTIHDNTCFALEEVETGSSYEDDPPSSANIPQTTLDKHFADLSSIVQSFSFARS